MPSHTRRVHLVYCLGDESRRGRIRFSGYGGPSTLPVELTQREASLSCATGTGRTRKQATQRWRTWSRLRHAPPPRCNSTFVRSTWNGPIQQSDSSTSYLWVPRSMFRIAWRTRSGRQCCLGLKFALPMQHPSHSRRALRSMGPAAQQAVAADNRVASCRAAMVALERAPLVGCGRGQRSMAVVFASSWRSPVAGVRAFSI
jgi:hypothetical protein